MTQMRWLALLNAALVLLATGLGVLAGVSGDWKLMVPLLVAVPFGAALYCWPTDRRRAGASPPAQAVITRTTGGHPDGRQQQ